MSSYFCTNWILLILLAGPTVRGSLVKGKVGEDITVPCSYNVQSAGGVTSMCWGRGSCPSSKCSQTIIWTDGWKVTEQYNSRYMLKGNLPAGDVSLTIVNAREGDSGTYCCRVEIPGWFNDQLSNHEVAVEKARISTASPHTYTSEQTTAHGSTSESSSTFTRTWPPVSASEAPWTASGPCSSTSDCVDVTTNLQNVSVSLPSQQYSENGLYIGIGLCAVLLAVLILALFLARRYLVSRLIHPGLPMESCGRSPSPAAKMSHFVLFLWIIIQIFTVHTASEAVRGVIGQTVQLPCSYQVARPKDISDMCWGRGPCPNSKCNNKILHTTGNRVTFRKSQRYNLRGYISYGDVSLTIGKLEAEDAGTYCCRIEIPGWFNDIKKNIQLEVVRAPPVMTTTTTKASVSLELFRKTTFAPQVTSDLQTTAETAVLLATTTPETTTATTESPAVITLETVAPPTFAVTANDAFPEAMVTTSALPDFSTGFQAADTRTEDDYVFCPTESVPFPGVTTEFPSTLPTAEGTESAHTSLTVEDLTAAEILSSSDDTDEKHGDNRDKFPTYAILIACLLVVSIVFMLTVSLLCKRRHTKEFIIKSIGPAEDLEKVCSGAEEENSIFSL
ncbi:PREDICTED: T-cell immunoglobulin and mucin domain-containing protein 4-like [Buceros rhinoceros silvestris]|nr:PREDICTED: T-cell immunoglobulin and mucin domain-containing protein 4-like [Buceros rhinoceros silvestris]